MINNPSDTICALATAPGGAIAVIRVSGSNAISAVARIFARHNGKPLCDARPSSALYGIVKDAEGQQVDDVLTTVFKAPNSYTGEDTAEISCHGSSFITQRILQLLFDAGCRQALPGEFTQRAFLNGKMDLSQAEAVADLIASTSSAQHRMAVSQLRGAFSSRLNDLRKQLLHLTSLMELELDFSDHEDLEFADRTELLALASEIEGEVSRLADSFRMGNAMKNGVPVAIVGKPNAGKSSILNALVGDERAIVSNIPGTTRDTVEDTTQIEGQIYRFVDTAGLRHTDDIVEQIGVERAYRQIEKSELVLWVVDQEPSAEETKEMMERIDNRRYILVYNKCDILNPADIPADAIAVSALTGHGIDRLRQLIHEKMGFSGISNADIIVSNARHHEALLRALRAIQAVEQGLNTGIPTDLVTLDLHECTDALGEIVAEGGVVHTEVLENIFKNFCIGK